MRWILFAAVAAGLALVAAGGYKAGYGRAEALYQAKILESEQNARKIETEASARLADAISERDKARADARADRASLDRVRGDLRDTRRQLSEASGASGVADGKRVASCERLLAESAELLDRGLGLAGEGAELSSGLSADKDAVVRSSMQ